MDILQDLYRSEINAKIEWFWDGGVDVVFGDEMNGWKDSYCAADFAEAINWMRDRACVLYPESDFALKYAVKNTSA